MVQAPGVITNAFADLCVSDVERSVAFYRRLLGLGVVADQEWYVELGVAGRVLLALVQSGHATVPACAGHPARGVLVSFEVDDLEPVAAAAHELGCALLVPPTRELGQFHCMVSDPDGTVVDVIERIAFDRADRARLAAYRRAHRLRRAG